MPTIHEAAQRGDVEALGRELASGVSPNALDIVPILLRAGATPPAQTTNAYLQKVIAAGGIDHYARNHLNALAKTFTPKLAHRLPKELVRLVAEYAFHVGDY